MIKSSPYTLLVKSYPQPIPSLRLIVDKDISAFTTVCLSFIVYVIVVLTHFQDNNVGLVNQAIERAPRWLIKKLTSTYLTLGLAEIGKSVGIADVEEVRAIVLSMVRIPTYRTTKF